MSQRDEAKARAEILDAISDHCSHTGAPLPEPAEPCPSCSQITTEVLQRIDTVAALLGYTQADEPTPCNMTHTPPFDFAQCETHDTTFALGDTCKFNGREMWEVYADEAQEQRGRAVRAEMERDRALLEETQPQIVTTADEFDALPVGSVVVDRRYVARMKNRAGEWAQAGMDPCPMHLLVDGYSMVVVHRPHTPKES